ncbi:hypothetical protein GCM10011371_03030 [Novosphingobium marinum]|uniref:Uncharacterized protein (DUF1330 family) n=1 Tax=Novosphingobium marinum TaxID=1514948 RepID=A0A7Z0BU76_9SPHN|nr:DUF1330 domain-containing protein [Novosphingobium marinum]NYH93995.1 uncharacterized protein (DUF1330 family) [Novosphingobium marinum]GGC18794.1 hypothetical protein GCM10011371_03030 [Novosphingobium marinum]
MPAYMIVTIDYTDPVWVEAYRREVPKMIERAGGRYLALSRAPIQLEGEHPVPQTVAIVEYPSIEAAQQFMASEEYRPHGEARRKGAKTTIYLVDDVLPPPGQ